MADAGFADPVGDIRQCLGASLAQSLQRGVALLSQLYREVLAGDAKP